MRLWTYRYEEDLRQASALNRPIITDGSEYYDYFRIAYHWMMEQMEARFGRPSFVTLPVWLWYAVDGVNKKPDMRRWRQRTAQKPMILIECEIDEDRVLLSDHQMWHLVLGNYYIPFDEEESQWFDAQETRLTDAELTALKRQSWPRVFDLRGGDPASWGPVEARQIQATTWSIALDELRSARLYG